MTQWARLCRPVLTIALASSLLGMPAAANAAAGDTLLSYNVDIVSDYVSRGIDVFVSKYEKSQKEHTSINVAPALQPSLTLFGPSGLSFGLWGSWAIGSRKMDEATGFGGLAPADEIDYTLAYDWKNKLGSFSAGYLAYTYPHRVDAALVGSGASNEVYIKYSAPFLDVIAPTLSHYVSVDDASDAIPGGTTYTALGFGGNAVVDWALNVGWGVRLQDITASVGYTIAGIGIKVSVANRPNPELLGGVYDKDGHYLVPGSMNTFTPDGVRADYPKTIAWLTLSYGGSVTE